MTFVWSTETDRFASKGIRHVLRNAAIEPSPLVADDRLAVCAQDGRHWHATWWNGYESTTRIAGTPQRAVRLLCEAIGHDAPLR